MKPIPFYVIALALAIPAALVGLELPAWYGVSRQVLAFNSDLRVFYTPGYMLRTGQRKQIYDLSEIRRNQAKVVAKDDNAAPFLHPAYEAIVFVPLSFLPYRTAYLAWAAINFLVLSVIFLLISPNLKELSSIGPKWMTPALLLGFMPIAFAIIEGQDSLFLLLVLILVYKRIQCSQFQAGLLLSLGMFRFQILLPIIALFLLWRSLKFVSGWALGSLAIGALSAFITGINAQMQYITLLRAMGGVSFWELLRRMPNLRALFAAMGLGIAPVAFVSAVIFCGAFVLGIPQNLQERLTIAISASALVPYYLFFHDLSILVLPMLLLLDRTLAQRDWARTALISLTFSGFAVFWFTSGKLYLATLLSLLFFVTQAITVRNESTTQLMPLPHDV